MDNISLSKINYIFYIPGSAGSLLSVLMKSQIEKDFMFDGFSNNTAHRYCRNAIANTHSSLDYEYFKKTDTGLEAHLTKNLTNDSLFQRLDIKWLDEFIKMKNVNKIICYVNDYHLKLLNFYVKLKDITLLDVQKRDLNFKINKDHKNYESLIFIKILNWKIKTEEKYLNKVTSIDMLPVLKKKYDAFNKICKITNISLLDKIIDDYNAKNSKDIDILPNGMKKYLQKHHSSI